MMNRGILFLLFALCVFSNGAVGQPIAQAEEVRLKVQSISVGSLFDNDRIYDMQADLQGNLWILSQRNLFYLVNEGVYEFDFPSSENGYNIHFIQSPLDSTLRYVSSYGISEIGNTHTTSLNIDLREIFKLNSERYIRDARYDKDGTLYFLVGDDDHRELWSLDSHLENPKKITAKLHLATCKYLTPHGERKETLDLALLRWSKIQLLTFKELSRLLGYILLTAQNQLMSPLVVLRR